MNEIDVKKIRIELGLNQTDFGKAIGYSRSAVQKWENGERNPDEKAIYAINKLLQKNTNDDSSNVFISSGTEKDLEEVENYTNKNGIKFYIYPDDTYKIEVLKIPFPAYATYLEVYNDEHKLKQEFTTTTFKVDKVAKGNYLAFDVKNDSMWNEGGYDTPDGAEILAREIGRHLWTGKFKQEKYGYILMTKQNIFHKDIKEYNEETGEITLSSRNPTCEDFKISINDVFRLFNVIKRTF